MSLITSELHKVWESLRASSPQRRDALLEVRIRNFRGIRDLRVPFSYPVCVLAGPNGCGKSTVLFTCACSYRDPDPKRKSRDLFPSSLFPNFTDKTGPLSDARPNTEFEFYYLNDDTRASMAWRRGESKSWNRSYMGRKGGRQPSRTVYLRTLSNLTNPSEVRSVLQIERKEYRTDRMTPDLLLFAHRILRQRYRTLSVVSDPRGRDLLVAALDAEHETQYSEFHMSSGERTILRISKDISSLTNALILIDEIDTGLHPYTQQQVMLELQRIALRKNLQVIVASHSPVVLDSVPAEARVFLDRDDRTAEVRLLPAYRDIFQKALYGQSRDQLSILCEDEVAEGLLRGFLDALSVEAKLHPDDFVIGRNTGKDEFPAHVRTLGKFRQLRNFLFVLDGDAQALAAPITAVAEEYGQSVQPLFLPGKGSPEAWIWEVLRAHPAIYRELFSLPDIEERMESIAQTLAGAVGSDDSDKARLTALAAELKRTLPDVARSVGRREAKDRSGTLAGFLVPFAEQIREWRRL